jgi:transcriptional regulator with XRE-family HTH domain
MVDLIQRFEQAAADMATAFRLRRAWSREQIARKLGASATVIYNYETTRSRVPLDTFLSMARYCNIDFLSVLSRYCLAINIPRQAHSPQLIKAFRQRLNFTQAELGLRLGYASSSMVHHFEKGIRQPSVVDLLQLMAFAGDDLRGLVGEFLGEEKARKLPTGQKIENANWHEYWELPFVPAMRQVMRTQPYLDLKQFSPGFLARALGITRGDERQGLEVLTRCGVIHWSSEKPVVNPNIKVVIPRDIKPETLNRFKEYWWRFLQRHYTEHRGPGIMSVDLIPMNERIFATVIEDIRRLQEKIHSLNLEEPDGFAVFGWGAGLTDVAQAMLR